MFIIVFFVHLLASPQANIYTSSTTFCVGGFNMSAPTALNSHACNKNSVRDQHPYQWHRHGFDIFRNTKTDACFICWDENDNTCDSIFLPQNPHFQPEGDVRNCKASNPSEIFQHVKNGEELEAPSTPPGIPVQPQIILRKGPYAVGEALQLTAQLTDSTGSLAKDDGQTIPPDDVTFTISHNGSTLTKVHGQLNPNGTVTATVSIPDSTSILSSLGLAKSYTVTATVNGNNLPNGYTLSTNTASQTIPISDCIDSLSVQAAHQSVASLIPVGLDASIKSGDLSNVNLTYEIKVMDPTALKDPSKAEWSVPASSTGSISWTPPELTHSHLNTAVNVYVTGTKAGATVCPSKTHTLSLSGQSILPEVLLPIDNPIPLDDDFGLFNQTKYCITNRPCKMKITFKRNPDIPSPILDAPDSTVNVINNNGDSLFQGKIANTLDFDFTPTKPGLLTPMVQIESQSLGQQTSLESSQIEVRDPLNLGLSNPINFGFVDQESWRSKCKIINVKQAGLRPQDALRFEVKNIDPSCNMEFLYLNTPSNKQFIDAVIIPVDEQGNGKVDLLLPNSDEFGICAKTDACGAYNSEDDNELNIIPLDPRLREFQHVGKVQWTSEKAPFWEWDCWGKILTFTLGTFAFLVFTYGYTKASRFVFHQQVQVSKSKRFHRNVHTYQLSETSARKLILFKGERVSFDNFLEPTRSSGVITCMATSYGFTVSGHGIQELNNNKWVDMEDVFIPQGSKVYRTKEIDGYYIKFFT